MNVDTGEFRALTAEVARLAGEVRNLAAATLASEIISGTSPAAARPGPRVRPPRPRPDYLRAIDGGQP